jgi:hypothetical protein
MFVWQLVIHSFTIDPGVYVDNRAESAELNELREISTTLPAEIGINENNLLNQTIKVEHLYLTFNEKTLLKAMVKYGQAIWHVYKMYQHLAKSAVHNHSKWKFLWMKQQNQPHMQNMFILQMN